MEQLFCLSSSSPLLVAGTEEAVVFKPVRKEVRGVVHVTQPALTLHGSEDHVSKFDFSLFACIFQPLVLLD